MGPGHSEKVHISVGILPGSETYHIYKKRFLGLFSAFCGQGSVTEPETTLVPVVLVLWKEYIKKSSYLYLYCF